MTAPTPTNTYTPSTVHLGGLTASSSLLETWNSCPQLFYLSYLAPHPAYPGSTGLTGYSSSEPLLFGTLWHSAMEGYRLTGWDFETGTDTGNYNADATLVHIAERARLLLPQFESEPQMEETRDAVQSLFRKWLAARDITTDWRLAPIPGTKLPMLEHELVIQIAGFAYTVKVDAGIIAPEGYFQIGEYKTSKAAWLHMAQKEARISIQARGEALALNSHFPTTPARGVRFMYAVKDRGAKSDLPQFPDLELDYDDRQLASFAANVERWMFDISSKVASYERLKDGTPEGDLQAGQTVFAASGMASKTCWKYNRQCTFFDYCESGGIPVNINFQALAPRLVNGIPFEREDGAAPLMDVDPSQL